MSHYHVEVHVEKPGEDAAVSKGWVRQVAEEILEGYSDHLYDWYQVGGRWTGAHSMGKYDPEKDKRNQEKPCQHCKGTGQRGTYQMQGHRKDGFVLGLSPNSLVERGLCNVCNGSGISVKWPTDWVGYEGDVIEVKRIPEKLETYYLVTSEDIHDVNGRIKPALKKLGINDGWLVTIDCHN